MSTFTKEQLIAHIKGRKEFADECASDSTLHPERREYYELSAAALEIALASLEADPVAWRWNFGGSTNWRLQECEPGKGNNEKCKRVVEPLYAARPAQVSVPEWTNEQCMEFLSIAFRHAEINGDLELDDIRLGVKMVNDSRDAMLQGAEPVSQHPELTVWYGSMPESNGKTNWTAILHRKGECLSTGITIERSEYPERVRYEADRVRHIIGELKEAPDILAYDADAHSGYVKPGNSPVIPDGWVACSERMPEDAQWCAVNTEYGYYVQCWSDGQGWLGDEISIPNCDVTHWMPLPAAPQQEVKS